MVIAYAAGRNPAVPARVVHSLASQSLGNAPREGERDERFVAPRRTQRIADLLRLVSLFKLARWPYLSSRAIVAAVVSQFAQSANESARSRECPCSSDPASIRRP
jgi:hypothetical protein